LSREKIKKIGGNKMKDLCTYKGCKKPYTREFHDEHGISRCCDEHYNAFKQASEEYKKAYPDWKEQLDAEYARIGKEVKKRCAIAEKMMTALSECEGAELV